ncbi:MAG: hypothetical protein ABIK65_02230 [Candidatus Eisenbacteria bacterium]
MEDRYEEWQDVGTKPGKSRRRKGRVPAPARKPRESGIEWLPEDVLDSYVGDDLDLDEDWDKYFQGEDDSE